MTVRTRLVAMALTATAGLLAVGTLSACQSQPGSAAFIGATRIPESTITDALADITSNSTGLTDRQLRALMVQDMTFVQVAEIYAAEKGYQLPTVTGVEVAQTAATAFTVKNVTQNQFFISFIQARKDANFLLEKQAPVTPTDAELDAAWNELLAIHAAKPEAEPAFKQAISTDKNAQVAFGLQRELTAVIADNPVSINPVFAPNCTATPCPGLGYTLYYASQQNIPIVTLPFVPSTTTPVVLDLPAVGTDTAAPAAPGGTQ